MFAQSYDWFVAHRADTAGDARRRARHSPHRRTAAPARSEPLKHLTGVPAAGRLMRRRRGAAPPAPRGWRRRRRWRLLAYVPALAVVAGPDARRHQAVPLPRPRPADRDAPWTFDARQFAGWVPHQVIAYLWPQGPWYWLVDARRAARLGRPPAVDRHAVPRRRHRRAVAGAPPRARRSPARSPPRSSTSCRRTSCRTSRGRRRCCCRGPASAGSSASPSARRPARTVARRRARRARRRHRRRRQRDRADDDRPGARCCGCSSPRPSGRSRGGGPLAAGGHASAGCRSACRCGGSRCSSIQGRHGADVLAYSESLESVSFTSTSPEVWRGLGYWLTYVRDAYAATTTAGARLHGLASARSPPASCSSLIGLAGLVVARWRAPALRRRARRHRRRARRRRPPDRRPVAADGPARSATATSGAALALRSSTRAVPVLVLGLALGAGALVDALAPACGWRPGGAPRAVAAAAWRARGLRRNLPVLTGPPPRRPGARPRRGPAGGVGRRRRRARRQRPRATACCSCPGSRVRRLPLGLHRRPAAARPDRPAARHPRPAARSAAGGDGPAVRPRRPLPVRRRSSRTPSPRSPACSAPTRSG